MAKQIETLASLTLDRVGMLLANDSARSSFTVASGSLLLALDQDLNIIGQWPRMPGSGWHASSPDRGLALMSNEEEVRLLREDGQTLWAHKHPAWSGGSGCTWFDSSGQPHAVVPSDPYWPAGLPIPVRPPFWQPRRRADWRLPKPFHRCRTVRFDLDSGRPVVETAIEVPRAMYPVHHPDGWVGLQELGPDAVSASWVRSSSTAGRPARIDMIHAPWHEWLLADVHHSGRMILTTPLNGGSLAVRSFPDLETVLSVDPPSAHNDRYWDLHACFVSDLIVAKLAGDDERLAVIDLSGQVRELEEQQGGWLNPAADGTWLTVSPTSIRRCRLADRVL